MAGAARTNAMGKNMQKAAAVGDDWLNRHGFPQGYHFVPDDPELLRLLEDMIAGRPLPHPLPTIFQHARIRDYHPAELHDLYKAHKEAGSIYFFNRREFTGSATVRPGRTAKDGWWKASGGGKPFKRGGLIVGYKLTLVFYERRPGHKDFKTDWAIKEYTIVGPNKKVSEMALYRLYKKSENTTKGKKATQEKEKTLASTWANEEVEDEDDDEEEVVVPPSLPHPPAGGTTSQAQAGQPHDWRHYYALGAAPGPSTSCWATPGAGFIGLTDTSSWAPNAGFIGLTDTSNWAPDAGGTSQAQPDQPHDFQQYPFGGAASAPGWDAPGPSSSWATPAATEYHWQYAGGPAYCDNNMPPPLVPSGPAPLAHDPPAWQQHFGFQEETAGPLKTEPPPTPPAPAAGGGYLDDEFDAWCRTQQDLQQAAASPAFHMPDGIDARQVAVAVSPLPMLEDIDIDVLPTDENSERLSCTLEELFSTN